MDGYMEAISRGFFIRFWPAFYRDWFEVLPALEQTDNNPMVPDMEDSDSDDDNEGSAEVAPVESLEPPKASKEKKKKKTASVSDMVWLIPQQ